MKNKEKIKVLHITPHLGGGVGSVVLNYLKSDQARNIFTHKVCCLEYANDNAKVVSKKFRFDLFDNVFTKPDKIIQEIKTSDIVLIHWWNHPLLYDFLVREKLPESRVVLWSHISGFYPPFVFTNKILEYPDLFVFTTPMSLETKEVKKLTKSFKQRLGVVWSTSGIDRFAGIKAKKHSGFNIGYIGTVDYAKLHPKFLDMCARLNIPDANVIVCGGPSEKEIEKEAAKRKLTKHITFMGLVSDVAQHLDSFDIFGYPLAPYHYGTCDQSLQESMAAGVVPVVLANQMEKYMVQNGRTGIVAKNEKEYIQAIKKLHKDKALRRRLSNQARKYAIENFSLDKMVQSWENIFFKMMQIPKTSKKWNIEKKEEITTADIFLESLGMHGQSFASYRKAKSVAERSRLMKRIQALGKLGTWKAKTRGTPNHYHQFFPKDPLLSLWSQKIK